MKLLAQITNPAINQDIGNPGYFNFFHAGGLKATSYVILKYLVNFLNIAFIVGSVGFLLMLLLGSVEYIIAGGEKEKVGNAQKRITSAIIGLIILFSVFAISSLINLVFGIDILKLEIPVI